MFEVKQSTAVWVPVRLFDSGGSAIAGVAFGAVELGILKSDGTYSSGTIVTGDWAEVTGGPATGAGLYRIQLSTTQTNTTGPLIYVVKSTTSKAFVGSIKVVAREEAETYTAVGALPDAIWDEAMAGHVAAGSAGAYMADLRDEALGKWEIFTTGPDANRLVLYKSDGVTVLKKFDLANSAGSPAFVNPFKRTPV